MREGADKIRGGDDDNLGDYVSTFPGLTLADPGGSTGHQTL
jgi:hypothetical protein